jgi:calcineurin-like phosphoesterase family protein
MFERPLKLTHNENHKVYFTSDSHFRHNQSFIFEARGYKDRYEHDNALIAKINEVVRPEDTLIHLGDFCLNITPPEFNEILARINCDNILYIWGNHNSCIRRIYEEAVVTEYGKDIEVYPYAVGKITYLGYYKELIVNGHMIVIHHYPIYSWNSMRKGSWCLHGHEHCAVTDHLPDGDGGKILDVGWDYYKSPVSFNEIQKIMHKKQIKSIGHH